MADFIFHTIPVLTICAFHSLIVNALYFLIPFVEVVPLNLFLFFFLILIGSKHQQGHECGNDDQLDFDSTEEFTRSVIEDRTILF